MNESELKLLWQSANETLERSLQINKNNADEITRLKVQHVLASMKPTKVFILMLGIIWVIGLGSILSNFIDKISLFFVFSAAIQLLLTAIAIGIYVYQLDLINKIDFSEPVLTIQEKVSKLSISTLNATRLLFLQLPVWTTFYWNEQMFAGNNGLLWILQGIVTLLFVYLALWLFVNIKYENRNKKWFQLIFRGKEWQPILQSMEFLDQLKQYQE